MKKCPFCAGEIPKVVIRCNLCDKLLEQYKDVNDWIYRGFEILNYPEHLYDEALEAFEIALEIQPKNHFAWWYKGSSLYMLEQFDEALEAFNEAIKQNPIDYSSWINKGWTLYKLRIMDESLGAFIQAKDIKSNEPDLWLYLGFLLIIAGNYEETISHLNKAIKFDPKDGFALAFKAFVLKEQGHLEEAQTTWKRALDTSTADAIRFEWTGLEHAIDINYKRNLVIASCDKMIEMKPNDSESWYKKGDMLIDQYKPFERSLDPLYKAIELNPNHANAWYDLGLALYMLKRYEESLQASSRAIELETDDIKDAWYNKGRTFYELGRYDEALDAFGKACELELPISFFSDVLYEKARTYSRKSDKKNLLKNLLKAAESDSSVKMKAKEDEAFKKFWEDEDFKIVTGHKM